MNEDCDDLQKELREHEEKSLNLFEEAEKLHQASLKIPIAKRGDAISEAFNKQREAIEEIHITADMRNKVESGQCEETENKAKDSENQD